MPYGSLVPGLSGISFFKERKQDFRTSILMSRLGMHFIQSFNVFPFLLVPISLFLFQGVSSSSECLGMAALFHCGTPWAIHITFSLVTIVVVVLC